MIRFAVYLWASPNTLLGLLFLLPAIVSGGGVQFVRGVLEIHGGFAKWFLDQGLPSILRIFGPASALTLGHVVLGQDREGLALSRDHEHIHVRQYERWGPFFLPVYFLASWTAWRQGLDPYRGNRFEQEAYDNS
jgi:hypothetical protein